MTSAPRNGAGRLDGRVAVVVGAGQTPGEAVGNGRAAALLYAREGARVLAVDRDLSSAEETSEQIRAEGGDARAWRADVTSETDLQGMVIEALARWGRVDVLHNNVGVAKVGGDAAVSEIDAESFTRLININLRGMVLACKHALPVMTRQGMGAIVNVASNAVLIDYPYVAYKTSKAGVLALTEHIAMAHAKDGIRANAILPGLMNTPMAVEHRVGVAGQTHEDVIAQRQRHVPLDRTGTAWDVAEAALFLASDTARFITGASLVVDGGQSLSAG